MSSKLKIGIAVGLMAIVAVVVLMMNRASGPSFEDPDDIDGEESGANIVMEETPLPPPPETPPPEIKFERELIVSNNAISIDGKPFENVPCKSEGITFGQLRLDEQTMAELHCEEDYMGGITMIIREPNGDSIGEKVGLVFGDAGEMSDTRSWFTKRQGKVTIEMATIWSFTPTEEESAPEECGRKAERLVFNRSALSLVEEPIEFDVVKFKFDPPAHVEPNCQNQN